MDDGEERPVMLNNRPVMRRSDGKCWCDPPLMAIRREVGRDPEKCASCLRAAFSCTLCALSLLL